ncbi:hypothetical protein QR680_016727 [Steinernema hermaphroditum]|uniref:RING-type domain-containing protein n=1 Tax=Steinernema hermaphroditum TaxID=289476 RepID=A0AA39HE38_9BILA|nr:hypothetical protein QR680_016727 [Steinernema hermaphroditum]
MEVLSVASVRNAVNAFAVADDGRKAFLMDNALNCIVCVDLFTGQKKTFNWKTPDPSKWLCYCLFAGDEHIYAMFYNRSKRKFFMMIYKVGRNDVLQKTGEAPIDTDRIRDDRLAYTAHKQGDTIQIIIYERYSRRHSSESHDRPEASFLFWSLSCSTKIVTSQFGTLPPTSAWELPFICDNHLCFVSIERQRSHLVSIPLECDESHPNVWTVTQLDGDEEYGDLPPRKAIWCNAWMGSMASFAVVKKVAEKRTISIWSLDMENGSWKKQPTEIEAPSTATNFSYRLVSPEAALLHSDWSDITATFVKVDLSYQHPSTSSDGDAESDENGGLLNFDADSSEREEEEKTKTYPDLTCPICLDTYEQPRSMPCGHAACFGCLQQMKHVADSDEVRCPICRSKIEVAPEEMPTNYALQEAIDAITKARQLSESSLRCGYCRYAFNEDESWICLTCSTSEEKANFCAICILKRHGEHKRVEVSVYNKKLLKLDELKVRREKEARKVLSKAKRRIRKEVEEKLLNRMMEKVSLQLDRLLDPMEEFALGDVEELSAQIVRNMAEGVSAGLSELSAKLEEVTGPLSPPSSPPLCEERPRLLSQTSSHGNVPFHTTCI